MKMIDIWLLGGLIFPFVIITILVIMDSLTMKEKNQVIDMKIKNNMQLRSELFMRSMQVIVPVIGGTLFLIYWIIGLYHFFLACPL